VLGVSAKSSTPTATALSSSSPSGESPSGSAPPGRCLEHEMHVSIASRRPSDPATKRGLATRVYTPSGELAGAPVR
jgi:hypothetical protein